MRILGHFLKPKGVREQKRLGNAGLNNNIETSTFYITENTQLFYKHQSVSTVFSQNHMTPMHSRSTSITLKKAVHVV